MLRRVTRSGIPARLDFVAALSQTDSGSNRRSCAGRRLSASTVATAPQRSKPTAKRSSRIARESACAESAEIAPDATIEAPPRAMLLAGDGSRTEGSFSISVEMLPGSPAEGDGSLSQGGLSDSQGGVQPSHVSIAARRNRRADPCDGRPLPWRAGACPPCAPGAPPWRSSSRPGSDDGTGRAAARPLDGSTATGDATSRRWRASGGVMRGSGRRPRARLVRRACGRNPLSPPAFHSTPADRNVSTIGGEN